ncbi:DMP19 family protein [Heyndrickxia sporothermodurans]|uniref:DMP19 family protein n=1 Tax=Heyndrickxia sporothermodurans TaxID=46224 RepID=UPI0035E353E4
MLIKMNSKSFHSFKDKALPRACFEHIIPLIRGKNNTVKVSIYSQLSRGQKSLFMFNAYFNHASNSLAEFYWWSSYYIAQPNAWSEIIKALQYFNAERMLNIIVEIEEVLKEKKQKECLENFESSYKDLESNPDLHTIVNRLFTNFNEISSATLTTIGEYIRNNPLEFIQFED